MRTLNVHKSCTYCNNGITKDNTLDNIGKFNTRVRTLLIVFIARIWTMFLNDNLLEISFIF